MKVLIIHTTYKYKGGEDTVVAEEMKLLKASGIDVQLLEFSNDGFTFLKVLQMPFNIASYFKTRKKLQAFKADVVHIHNFHFAASPSVIYAVKSKGVPLVFTLHNYRLLCPSATLFYNDKLFLESLKQKFPWKAISFGVYKNSKLLTLWLSVSMHLHKRIGTWQIASRFIVLTPHAEKVFLESDLKLPHDCITVKPNFSFAPRLTRNPATDYFLYVGRLSEEKGIMLLLKTFSASVHKIKIAGTGPLRDVVADYSVRFPNIEFMGAVNKDTVFTLLSNASALIFPSVWYEGMPLTIIEAFACGLPVIASRIGAMEYMISDCNNGLHFDAGNENDLLAKLDRWQSLSFDKKEVYRSRAWDTYTRYYSPQNNLRELVDVYKSVLRNVGRPLQPLRLAHKSPLRVS